MDILLVNQARCRKPYGFLNFLFDIFMICITSGLWLLWTIIREAHR